MACVDPALSRFEPFDVRVVPFIEDARERDDLAACRRVAAGAPHFDERTPSTSNALSRAVDQPSAVVQTGGTWRHAGRSEQAVRHTKRSETARNSAWLERTERLDHIQPGKRLVGIRRARQVDQRLRDA